MENSSELLESRVATLERVLLGKDDSILKDTGDFVNTITDISDDMRNAISLWSEGLVLSPSETRAVRTDLADIIMMSKEILHSLM